MISIVKYNAGKYTWHIACPVNIVHTLCDE